MELLIVIIILYIAVRFLLKNKRKKDTFNKVFFQPKTTQSEKERQRLIQEHLHKDIGNTEPICPYCNKALPSFPSRKTICKECKNPIFVVKRPFDSKTVLTTEKGKNILNTDRDNIKHYFLQEDFFEYEEQLKKIRNGGYTPPSDVYWYKLQCKALIAFANKDYSELHMVYFYRGHELLKLGGYKDALKCFLQSDYIAACGGSKDGFVWRKEDILKSDYYNGDVNFALWGPSGQCIEELNLSEDELIKLFLEADFEQLPYPVERSFFVPAIRKYYKELKKTTVGGK